MINTGNSTLDAILLILGFLLSIFTIYSIAFIMLEIDYDNYYEDWNNFKFRKKKYEGNMKVGDYVRTKDYLDNQLISKIKEIYDDDCIETDKGYWDNEHIIKSSPNIIDLIEVGDYVNGYKITNVVNEEPCPSGKFVDIDCDKDSSDSYFFENDIKTIVTKEQFSQMEYRIGG